jgi:hypothetical protein
LKIVLKTRKTTENSPGMRVVAKSPIASSIAFAAVLRAQARDHRFGVVDARDRHSARGERQRDAAGADGELERAAVSGELREHVRRRA